MTNIYSELIAFLSNYTPTTLKSTKIKIGKIGNFFILNYVDDFKGNTTCGGYARTNPVFRAMRNVIVGYENDKWFLVSRSFIRFFNQFETEGLDDYKMMLSDFKNVKVFEKYDGYLINVFYRNDRWFVSTRGSDAMDEKAPIVSGGMLGSFESFMNLNYSKLNTQYTYIFEMCNPCAHTTKYTNVMLRVLTIFDGIEELDDNAIQRECDTAELVFATSHTFDSVEDVDVHMATMPDDFEGYVFKYVHNDEIIRIKYKNKRYLDVVQAKMITKKDVVKAMLMRNLEEFERAHYVNPDLKKEIVERYDFIKNVCETTTDIMSVDQKLIGMLKMYQNKTFSFDDDSEKNAMLMIRFFG